VAVNVVEDVILSEAKDRPGSDPILRSLRSLRMTVALLVLSTAGDLFAQLPGQSFAVTPYSGTATVGDTVTVRFRIRLHERDQLLDSFPQVAGDLPPGVRVQSVEKLGRIDARLYEGSARLAFFRPGRRPVPIFGVSFMRVVEGVSRATLPSDSAFVLITGVLPSAGNPSLKDIRELEKRPLPSWMWPAILLALFAAGWILRRHRNRRTHQAIPVEHESIDIPMSEPTPYEIALDRLRQVEAERWPSRGLVELQYEAVAQTLRQYLEEAYGVGALERTTAELVWAMPPQLGRGRLRDACREVLGEADLVKFAEARPDAAAAADFLRRARELLSAWHGTSRAEEATHAVR
jgi:hypothetical protein